MKKITSVTKSPKGHYVAYLFLDTETETGLFD